MFASDSCLTELWHIYDWFLIEFCNWHISDRYPTHFWQIYEHGGTNIDSEYPKLDLFLSSMFINKTLFLSLSPTQFSPNKERFVVAQHAISAMHFWLSKFFYPLMHIIQGGRKRLIYHLCPALFVIISTAGVLLSAYGGWVVYHRPSVWIWYCSLCKMGREIKQRDRSAHAFCKMCFAVMEQTDRNWSSI